MGISREAQDDYGIESYRRTEAAIKSGVFDREITPVEVGGKTKKMVTGDEEVGRCDYDTFRQTRTYWGQTVGVGSSSKVTRCFWLCVREYVMTTLPSSLTERRPA